ncbi:MULTISPECIES: HEAT repeat domain-containing protein [Nostocales]|uniref:NACHT C-terminal Cysteine and Histidine-containing domain-containing protein n=3 Tax=Nostocales TaxID=1161 RepID=A0A0C1RG19_9CYAN|nr:hypothetical protein [Tolypothrix bouteillei]KAF3887140.1 hypothetical protein DA73_0400017830 [Tolypothrix bouteillei VB521301]
MHDFSYFLYHVPHNLSQSIYRIFEPQCKAEILHWFSREDIPNELKEEFMKLLLNFEDDCGNFYRSRAYLLAAEALNHFEECSLGDAIVQQLLQWSYVYFGWQNFPKPLQEEAKVVLNLTDKKRVIAAFELLIQTTESQFVLQDAALRLGQIDLGNQIAITALVKLLQVTENERTLGKICQSLGEIACNDENAIAALVDLLEITSNKGFGWNYLYVKIFVALDKIAYSSSTAIAALTKFLQMNQDDRISCCAAKCLLRIDPGNATAKKALVNILETTERSDVLFQAAMHLQKIAPGNTDAIAALSTRLEKTKEDDLLCQAVISLGKITPHCPAVSTALTRIVETSENLHSVTLAAAYLLSIKPDNKRSLSTVINRLETTQDDYYRYRIAGELLRRYPSNEVGISTLLSIIEKNLDCNASCNAISTLHRIRWDEVAVATRQKAIKVLLGLLVNQGNCCDYIEVARAILAIEPGNEIAIATLVKIMENDGNDWLRRYAAEVLIQTNNSCEKALNTIVDLAHLDNGLNVDALLVSVQEITQKNQMNQKFLDNMIAAKVKLIQTFEEEEENKESLSPCHSFSYELSLLKEVDKLLPILQDEHLPKVVSDLKDYLSQEFYQQTSYRYEAVYKLLWHCAQRMTYQEFYQSWH